MTPKNLDSIAYVVEQHSCELRFQEISNPGADHPLYEVVFSVDGRRANDWAEKEPTQFNHKSIHQIVKETIAKLNSWCKLHPNSFLYFWDIDFSARFFRLYRRAGFICDGRLENYVTCIDAQGQRTVFDGMLNSLPEECWQCTDLWRFVGSRYYKGNRETPVDILKALLSEIELKQRPGGKTQDRTNPQLLEFYVQISRAIAITSAASFCSLHQCWLSISSRM